jgi:hypothetical protein
MPRIATPNAKNRPSRSPPGPPDCSPVTADATPTRAGEIARTDRQIWVGLGAWPSVVDAGGSVRVGRGVGCSFGSQGVLWSVWRVVTLFR